MFVAYDKIPHQQYPLYETYALLIPGEVTLRLAVDIAGHAEFDSEVKGILTELRALVNADEVAGSEWRLIAIRDATGDFFDLYLMDEDGLFEGFVPAVSQADILRTAQSMLDSNLRIVAGRKGIAVWVAREEAKAAELTATKTAAVNAAKKNKK